MRQVTLYLKKIFILLIFNFFLPPILFFVNLIHMDTFSCDETYFPIWKIVTMMTNDREISNCTKFHQNFTFDTMMTKMTKIKIIK